MNLQLDRAIESLLRDSAHYAEGNNLTALRLRINELSKYQTQAVVDTQKPVEAAYMIFCLFRTDIQWVPLRGTYPEKDRAFTICDILNAQHINTTGHRYKVVQIIETER